MDNILNGKKINRGHGFGITDNYFTELGLSTPIDLPHEQYPVVYFPNPKQGWWDKLWNGTSYIFMTLDYISCALTKRTPDPASQVVGDEYFIEWIDASHVRLAKTQGG